MLDSKEDTETPQVWLQTPTNAASQQAAWMSEVEGRRGVKYMICHIAAVESWGSFEAE